MKSDQTQMRRAVAQFIFGQLQIVGATAGFILLVTTGISTATILTVTAAGVVTLTSRFLFWRRKQ
jgi:hypothetical protein